MKKPTEAEPINTLEDAVTDAERRRATREEKDAALETVDRDRIDEILLSEEMGKGGKIRVSRKGPLDQTHQYVCTIPADQWDTETTIEHLKKNYGGGDYKCQTFRAKGAMYKPFEFSIDHRFKGMLDEDQIRRLSVDNKSGNGMADTMKMFEMMRANQQQDGFKSGDILAMMEKSTGQSNQMFMFMMTMMMKSNESNQQNMTTMLTAMATLTGGQNRGMDPALLEILKQKQEHHPMKETLEMMAMIKELFDKPKEAEEKDEDMWTKLARLAPGIIKGLTGQAEAPPTVTAALPEQPQAQQQLPPQQPPAAKQPGGLYAVMPVQYQMLINMAIAAAEKGSDAGLYADLLFDQLDDKGLRMVTETLTPPDWCARLFGDETIIAHIRPWFDELRGYLLNPQPNEPKNNIPPGPATSAENPVGQQPT